MKSIVPFAALALLVVPAPAIAQMCGPGQAQASGGMSSGMMCGMMMGQTADDPMADKKPEQTQRASMCPCCRNMAMMRGGMGGMQHHNMPGMDTRRP